MTVLPDNNMPAKRCRVLFLLQRPEAWVNLASIHEAMEHDQRFQPTVWLLPYNVRDPAQSARKLLLARSLLSTEQVEYAEWREGMFPSTKDFDAVIFSHPYDRERPASLSFDRIAAAIPITIYVPYGLPMGGGQKNLRLQFAQPTQARAALVVARSESERALYTKYCPTGDSHVQIIGHPRFDKLQRELKAPIPDDLIKAIRGRKTVLWNAHFSFGPEHSQGSNFSTFDLLGPEIFRFALKHRERLCLIWRPHPGLWPALIRNNLIAPTDLPALRDELAASGIVLDESPGHAAAFRSSEALISDVGSFLLEYLVTGKPILVLRNPEGEPLNAEAEALVAGYHQAHSPPELTQFLECLLKGEAKTPDQELIRRHLPCQDGEVGARILEAIAGLMGLNEEAPPMHHSPDELGLGRLQATILNQIPHPLPPTPTLDQLCSALMAVRRHKETESHLRKKCRRAIKMVRTTLVEWIKLHTSTLHTSTLGISYLRRPRR